MAAGQGWGGLHLVQVQQGLVQHPLCTEMLLFGALQFIFQVINGLLQLGYRSFSKLSTGLCLRKHNNKQNERWLLPPLVPLSHLSQGQQGSGLILQY